MPNELKIARLTDRALIAVTGPDAAVWLNGLISQSSLDLGPDEMRAAAMLTPQGKLAADMILQGAPDGLILDVDAEAREGLIRRLSMYRLRAKVQVAPTEGAVYAVWGEAVPSGMGAPDPRLAALGHRLIAPTTAPKTNTTLADYAAHRRRLGVAETAADGLADKVYAVEANLDLLNGVDFHKGCFVGQETTSRMKRRGVVKSRVLPFQAPAAAPGDELLAGDLRAGEVLAFADGLGLALVRLDRGLAAALTLADAPVELLKPQHIETHAPSTGPKAASSAPVHG